MKHSIINPAGALIVVASSFLSLICLVILHFLSPEFDPGWRMVSEYALGNHKLLITLFFVFWGLSSITLAFILWNHVSITAGRTGLVLLFISGIGELLAAVFDVTKADGHGIAGMLGVPALPVAALLITFSLVKKNPWSVYRKVLVWSAHFTWVSLLGMVVAMMIMMSGFANAGIEIGPNSPPPASLPDEVLAINGYTNRFLILCYQLWLVLTAYTGLQGELYSPVVSGPEPGTIPRN